MRRLASRGTNVLLRGCLASLLALCAPAARAATLTVTNTGDSGAGSLRATVVSAASGDTIVFSVSGTITLTTGVISLSKNLTIDGGGAVTVDGNNASRIFDVNAAASVSLKNLTLTHARVTGSNGGAIVVAAGSSLVVDTCTLTANTTTSSGGALANLGSTTFLNSTITGNTTGGGGGGAVYSNGPVVLSNSTVSGNSAPNNGGAFYSDDSGTLSIVNSTFSGNSASANGGGGGALATRGQTTITASTFSGNTAVGYGGAIRADTSGTALTPLNVDNSTFSGNATNGTAGGGAIAVVNAGIVNLYNTTIASNSALGSAFGGGVYVGGGTTVQAKNSVLSNNTAPGANGQDCVGMITSLGYNLVSSVQACTVSGTLTGNVTGSSANLGALANNGGPTQTMALNAGSPAIDTADPAGCVDHTGATLTTDQRGLPRPSGVRCDMGAFEVQGAPPPPAALTVSKAAPGTVVSGQTLTYTLTYGNTGGTAATSVVISDAVPAGTTFVSATGGGVLSAGNVVWNIPTLGAGVTGQTVSFTVTVNAASGSVSNATYSIAANGVAAVAGAVVSTSVQPAGGGPAAPVPTLTPLALAAAGLAALRRAG